MKGCKIREISSWVRDTPRGYQKSNLVQDFWYPFFDHQKHYECIYKNQTRSTDAQTFIVSYPYKKAYDNVEKSEFMETLNKLELRFHIQECIFRDKKAYQIIISENKVDLDSILDLLN